MQTIQNFLLATLICAKCDWKIILLLSNRGAKRDNPLFWYQIFIFWTINKSFSSFLIPPLRTGSASIIVTYKLQSITLDYTGWIGRLENLFFWSAGPYSNFTQMLVTMAKNYRWVIRGVSYSKIYSASKLHF